MTRKNRLGFTVTTADRGCHHEPESRKLKTEIRKLKIATPHRLGFTVTTADREYRLAAPSELELAAWIQVTPFRIDSSPP